MVTNQETQGKRKLVIALTGIAMLLGVIVLTFSFRHKSDPDLWLALRKQGDTKAEAGHYQQAMDLFQKAVKAAPAPEVGLYVRIADAAAQLGQREQGLEAVKEVLKLRPDLKDNPKVTQIKQQLDSLASVEQAPGALNNPAKEQKIGLAVATCRLTLAKAQQAIKDDDSAKAQNLTRQARKQLLPALADPNQNDVRAWRLLGAIALVTTNTSDAAYAFEAIQRLKPDYLQDAQLTTLMAELNQMPIQDEVAKIPGRRRSFLAKQAAAANGHADAMCALGVMCHDGSGVPRNDAEAVAWYRKAAAKGDADGVFDLNSASQNQEDQDESDRLAMVWYRKKIPQFQQATTNVISALKKDIKLHGPFTPELYLRLVQALKGVKRDSDGWVLLGRSQGFLNDTIPANSFSSYLDGHLKQLASPGFLDASLFTASSDGLFADDNPLDTNEVLFIEGLFGLAGKGVLVYNPFAGGFAAGAGLQVGDIITAVNGRPVSTAKELRQVTHSISGGETVTLRIFRYPTFHKIKVTLASGDNISLLRIRAEAGDIKAAESLANDYSFGEHGVREDDKQANHWHRELLTPYREAAAKGDASAMKKLGDLYDELPGTWYRQALTWYRKAAARGNSLAMIQISVFYAEPMLCGHVVPQNKEKARQWLRKAAIAGSIGAIDMVADTYADKNDFTTAVKWYYKAAARGNAVAMDSIARYGQWPYTESEKEEALNSMNLSQWTLYRDRKTTEYRLEWYRKAAAKGNLDAIEHIGDDYFNGFNGLHQDYAQAFEWFRKWWRRAQSSTRLVLPISEFDPLERLGEMCESGKGVEQDHNAAVRWYLKAYLCDSSDSAAKQWLQANVR